MISKSRIPKNTFIEFSISFGERGIEANATVNRDYKSVPKAIKEFEQMCRDEVAKISTSLNDSYLKSNQEFVSEMARISEKSKERSESLASDFDL